LILPAMDRAALLLDLDGTLLDIAPTPDAVVVPPALLSSLTNLRDRLGGALAVISGRPVEQVDALLQAIPTAVSGEHGGALRAGVGAAVQRPDLPAAPADWYAAAAEMVAAYPGALLECKARGFVVHYRLAARAGPALHDQLAALIAARSADFLLLRAHMAWEVRPAGTDKGTALRAIMALAPFAGRLPVFLGDDVTDQDAILVARALGGAGLFVPDVFGDAAGVRAWLAAAARAGAWPDFAP
jgi:trehalose 6-phosphate phosphatase